MGRISAIGSPRRVTVTGVYHAQHLGEARLGYQQRARGSFASRVLFPGPRRRGPRPARHQSRPRLPRRPAFVGREPWTAALPRPRRRDPYWRARHQHAGGQQGGVKPVAKGGHIRRRVMTQQGGAAAPLYFSPTAPACHASARTSCAARSSASCSTPAPTSAPCPRRAMPRSRRPSATTAGPKKPSGAPPSCLHVPYSRPALLLARNPPPAPPSEEAESVPASSGPG